MKNKLVFHGKSIEVKLTNSALAKTKELSSILLFEIQIYFSCLLVKRLAIYSDEPVDGAWQLEADQFKKLLNDSLNVADKLFIPSPLRGGLGWGAL